MEPNENTEKIGHTDEDIDVEGHRRAPGRIDGTDDDDDVEGHRRAAGRIDGTDDEDDDVEGHRFKKA